jgi:hypothetical protein
MNKFINRLPLDIVLQIIPYTYNLQNKNLLEDIVNYTQTKKILFELYYKFWMIDLISLDPEEDKNWLINDIFGYANNNHATMHGYIDNFYNIFKRNIFLQSNAKIDKYVVNLEKKNTSTQINIFLGLLTIKERKDIVLASPRTV